MYLYPGSSSGNILQNYSTVSQPGYRHWSSEGTEYSCPHKDPPVDLYSHTHVPPAPSLPSALATTNLFSVSVILSFQECYVSLKNPWVFFREIVFILMESSLSTFNFMDHTFGVECKNSAQAKILKIFSYFFSNSFMVSGFTVKSGIHLESMFA